MFIALLLCLTAWFGPDPDTRISTSLLEATRDGQRQPFLIVMREQADLSVLAQVRGKQAKGREAFRLLHQTATKSQASVLDLLTREGAPVQSFYMVNMIRSEGDLALLRKLASHPDVAYIAADAPIQLTDYKQEPPSPLRSFDQVTWGIARIQADSVWALGYTGEGVVVGGQDTGYEWEHPALLPSYRGWNNGQADHNYHWHDAIHQIDPLHGDSLPDPSNNPCGIDSPVPCDDNNHGTHTMGTMTGIDSSHQIGIAYNAKWIGCRNMERGWGRPSSYIECFEWFLAPTDLNDENPDPDMAPHVIANSWSCPPVEGCEPSNFALMELVVNNLKAAGVVVVVSAGNSGPGCSSINTPAAIFENSFTVGATRDVDTIANFSSRGPVTVDGSGRIKPDVSAPGVGVRSSIRNGGYAAFSGTSMAGPHVAGAVALIISARPELAGEVALIEDILQNTSVFLASPDTCGGIPGTNRPNPAYGWGRIDVFEAVKAALDLVLSQDQANLTPLHIYPNPFREVLHIQLPTSKGEATFTLLDASGRIVHQQVLPSSGGALHLVPMPRLPGGWYAYRIDQGEKRFAGLLFHD